MRKDEKHKTSMEKQKTSVDASIAAADTEKSVVLLLTGNGKGKTSSAFGMVMLGASMWSHPVARTRLFVSGTFLGATNGRSNLH